jgi:uncharacterized protein YaiE (UPF0345 family)
MIKVNEYFNGTVKSLGFENSQGKSTVGIMEAGEYEFGTGAPERMTLISGSWQIKLPGESEFKNYKANVAVNIPANSKFQLQIQEQSAYFCEFVA